MRAGARFFPLDRRLKLTKHPWSPQTIQQALRLGVEIASYERAAGSYTELTGVGLSASTLQRLVGEYGGEVVEQQAQEAQAMVQVPKDETEVVWRKTPQPDSAVMAVSSDGVLVHIRDEGWKEVKAVSISAVNPAVNPETGEQEVVLSRHSYRAGLWEASTFATHHWAEACRRGLEKAQTIVCVSDGAAWIWAIVFMCFAARVEILDWWHAVTRLWDVAHHRLETGAAAAWVQAQKASLAHSRLRDVLHQIRLLYPPTQPLPDVVHQAVGYFFHNRHRMNYAAYRQAGLPIGSGTIESACKTVVQARMKQAGMRWSRDGAQAMLALRCLLLSNRWQELAAPP